MPPTFYLAIGGRSSAADLRTALVAGQRHFLVPAGTGMAELLRTSPEEVRVVLDSGAWPPDNPDRLSLESYAAEVLRWRDPSGGWGRLDWFAAYDHILDPAASQRDERRLGALLPEDAPLVPVTHYPAGRAGHLLLDLAVGRAGCRADLVEGGGEARRPCCGVGGLVPPLAPTRPHAVHRRAARWYDALLDELGAACDEGAVDPAHLGLHLFGIGRPAFTLRSPLVTSFDSSGPVQQARFGWQKIAPGYCPAYGLSAARLQTSRQARIAYWTLRYRALAGLPWRPFLDEAALPDDPAPPTHVQQSLFDRAA